MYVFSVNTTDKSIFNTRTYMNIAVCVLQSREEQHFVGELLNMMVYLSPDTFDTIVELLAMLANKAVDLK